MPSAILGLSAFYHDSAAAILVDGEIVAAAQEERFTRKKHDPDFPANALAYVMAEAGLKLGDLSAVAFYDKPYLKFERLLETYHGFAPKGLRSFLMAMPVWIKEKLLMRSLLREELAKVGEGRPRIVFPEHHLSHAASAFYPSPFEEAAILTLDGVGEWATSTIGFGQGREITILRELHFPHSLGLLYSAFTYYCGFKVNSGEYKLMGLAPYGNPDSDRTRRWRDLILEELVDRSDGSLPQHGLFQLCHRPHHVLRDKWTSLFGLPPRARESRLDQRHMDLALAIQQVTEEIVLRLADTAKKLTGAANLVMAGGVALNCVANGKLLAGGPSRTSGSSPPPGDAGGALGAALAAWHIVQGKGAGPEPGDGPDAGRLPGAGVSGRTRSCGWPAGARPLQALPRFRRACKDAAALLAQGQVVGWFQGRMEFGPPGPGQPHHPGRPPAPGDAEAPQSEDQIPGGLPALRTFGADGGVQPILRTGVPLPLHAAGGPRPGREAPALAAGL